MMNDVLIWGALFAVLIFLAVDKRRKIGALTLAYFITLSIGHVPGVLPYLEPGFHLALAEPTKVGFDTTLIGMTLFCVGALVARVLPSRSAIANAYRPMASAEFFSRIGRRMLMIGATAYFVGLPLSSRLPSFTAIASVTGLLLILGFWLKFYTADNRQTLLMLAMLPLLPLSTLVTGGFIGFGTIWAVAILAFQFVIAQRRIAFYLAGPPMIFLGLSLFVTYGGMRNEIREVVWDQGTTTVERLEKVAPLYTDFQLLDLSNPSHLMALDERLNQNWLVGAGVMRHREGEVELLYGESVPVWALIPRAIWPDKPAVGGGGELAQEFAGIKFAEGTSVGVGQVLEFYMNFGMPGVVIGFAVLGFIIMRLDQKIMCALAIRNMSGLMRCALPGLALLSPLGDLKEIIVTVLSAVIVSQGIIYFKLLQAESTQKPSAKIPGQPRRVIMWR
jgi:hypothetical protein